MSLKNLIKGAYHMSKFKEIKPEQLQQNPFQLIGGDWMLVTAKTDEKVNTMTASWGGLGVMWNKNVAYVVIRPQRYTKQFVDNASTFSLTFFDNSFRSMLSYMGKTSGRDENKIEKSNLTLLTQEDTPYFEEANISIFCKKLFAQEIKPDCFIDQTINEKWYPTVDHHTLYIAEITTILVKDLE